jgi:hypothetical protein
MPRVFRPWERVMTKDGTAGDVSVSGSQGVQAGSHIVQNNYFGPTELSFLTTLSPHKAMMRLRAISHEEAVSALASAPLGDATEVFKVLLDTDADLAVALLGDLNPRTARLLIEASDASWLDFLPDAVKAIDSRARELKWDRDGDTGKLQRMILEKRFTVPYVRMYAGGVICWEPGPLPRISVAIRTSSGLELQD